MATARLRSPLIRVIRDGQEPIEIQTSNPDLVLWDKTRARKRPPWPKFDEAPFLWLSFLAWSALRRTGQIPTELTYEQWETENMDVSAVDPDSDDDETGNPTRPEAGAG